MIKEDVAELQKTIDKLLEKAEEIELAAITIRGIVFSILYEMKNGMLRCPA